MKFVYYHTYYWNVLWYFHFWLLSNYDFLNFRGKYCTSHSNTFLLHLTFQIIILYAQHAAELFQYDALLYIKRPNIFHFYLILNAELYL